MESLTAFTPKEVSSVVQQQVSSVTQHPADPVAIGRTEKGANILQQSLSDPDLIRAANEIYQDPGKLKDVLTNLGLIA